MNLILQINDNIAHAVKLGDSPTISDLESALGILVREAGESRFMRKKPLAFAANKTAAESFTEAVLARAQASAAIAPPYPYPSHKDHAKGDE